MGAVVVMVMMLVSVNGDHAGGGDHAGVGEW